MSDVYLLYKAHYIKLLLLYFLVYRRFRHFSQLLVADVLDYLVVHFSRSKACLLETDFILVFFWLRRLLHSVCLIIRSNYVRFEKSNSQHHISIYMYFKNHTKLSVGKQQQNYMHITLTFTISLKCVYALKDITIDQFNYRSYVIFYFLRLLIKLKLLC